VNDTLARCVENQLRRIHQPLHRGNPSRPKLKLHMFNSAATSLLVLPSANSRRILRSRVARSSVENHKISG
jgi:hypothetical protein